MINSDSGTLFKGRFQDLLNLRDQIILDKNPFLLNGPTKDRSISKSRFIIQGKPRDGVLSGRIEEGLVFREDPIMTK